MKDLESYIYGGGIADEKGMLKAIEKMESMAGKDAKAEYELGIAYRNFACWHRHAFDELPFVEKAVEHFKKSIELLPKFKGKFCDDVDNPKLMVQGDLITLLTNNVRVRDWDLAEKLTEELIEEYTGYLPCYCCYIHILYSQKRYKECIAFIISCKERIANDDDWYGAEPPFLNKALGKALKKLGIESPLSEDWEKKKGV